MRHIPLFQYQGKTEPPPSIQALLSVTRFESAWHRPWSEPIRLTFKRSLRACEQPYFFAPSRYLPTPNVTARMSAVDTDNYNDKMSAFINVYVPKPVPEISLSGANTSIIEE